MSDLETPTINTEEPAASSAQVQESGDLVSTVPMPEMAPPSEETIKTEDTKDSEVDDGKEAPKAENGKPVDETEKPKGDDARLDKHPRFKSLIDTNRDLRTQNQELMTKFESLMQKIESGSTEKPEAGSKGFFDGKSNEELTDLFDENPQQFLANFADQLKGQFKNEFTQEFQQQRVQETQEQAYRRGYEEFAEKNEGFLEMWDSGEIPALMEKNPSHNAISAFYAITEASRNESTQAQIDEAVKKAVEAEREKINKNIKAKRSITTLPAAPRETGGKADTAPELKDSKKYGGTVSVLARRLANRRQQTG